MKGSILFVSIIALVLAVPLMAAQQPVPAEGQGQDSPKPSDQSTVRTFEGELSKIDVNAKTITVKGTSPDREMVFSYDDQTEVIGSETGVQGLMGNTGAKLKISYRDQKGTNQATKIEIQAQKV